MVTANAQDRDRAAHRFRRHAQSRIWRSALAWQVTLFLGINSLVYYVIIGWLPAILQSLGYSEAQAGSLHGLLQLATAAPGWRFR
jgi:cyanate permease